MVRNRELIYKNSIKSQVENLYERLSKNDFKSLKKFFKHKFSIEIEITYYTNINVCYGKVYRYYGNFNSVKKKLLFKDEHHYVNDFENIDSFQSFLRHLALRHAFYKLIYQFELGELMPDIRVSIADVIDMLRLNDDMARRVRIINDPEYDKLINSYNKK